MSEPLQHWIGGESVASVDGTARTGTDPSTGRPGTRVSLGTAADVDRAVRAAHRARTSWRHLGSLDRGRILAAVPRQEHQDRMDMGQVQFAPAVADDIMHEEIFGPVVSAVPFDTEDEVLALANNTRFGLGAAVWTRDISRAHRMAAAIESGQVWVNCYQAADSALPFGGTKESGWGRETCRETLEEYLETKTVVVSL